MNFKKRVNGSWHDTPHYIHNTSTDTITTLPAVLYPNAATVTVGLKGNMEQTGTPTPANPIQPSECGERTSNLFNIATITTGYRIQWTTGNPYEDETAVMSDYIPVTTGTYSTNVGYLIVGYDNSKAYVGVYRTEGTWEKRSSTQVSTFTVSAGSDVSYIKLLTYGDYASINEYTRVNEGSTSLPLEPYGYKIPISSANTTTNIYLGEVETTRKIGKYVFTGEENIIRSVSGNATRMYYVIISAMPLSPLYCTHFKQTDTTVGYPPVNRCNFNTISNFLIGVDGTQFQTADDFKTYLAQQYAAGTPVTIWYVLATEETGIVNEPIRKIGDYADEVSGVTIPTIAGANIIDVDTTLKPSEVSVNYHGWHPVQSVHEYENGAWD